MKKVFVSIVLIACMAFGLANAALAQEGLTFTVNGVSFTMKYVEGGTFLMGAQSNDPQGENYDPDADDWEKPIHSVTLSPYYIAETEVTMELWIAVMGKFEIEVADGEKIELESDDKPVFRVSWNDCQAFLRKLKELTGKKFYLPTAAQWEFAAKGGNKSHGYKYAGSDVIDSVAWYYNPSLNKHSYELVVHSVGTKQPNELGLYDMSGNVSEWCYDWATNYSSEAQVDPLGPSEPLQGYYCVVRGGSCILPAKECRVSCWGGIKPSSTEGVVGFRMALSE